MNTIKEELKLDEFLMLINMMMYMIILLNAKIMF